MIQGKGAGRRGGGDWDGETGETEMRRWGGGQWGGGGEGGEELARARSGKERGRRKGGQEGVGWLGETGLGQWGGDWEEAMGRGKMERRQL